MVSIQRKSAMSIYIIHVIAVTAFIGMMMIPGANGADAGTNPLMAMGGGLSDQLSSVLDCTFQGKTGLCVPRVLKDIVCAPLGFLFDEDVKTCGTDNVCCHSKVDGNSSTSSGTATTAVPSDGKNNNICVFV